MNHFCASCGTYTGRGFTYLHGNLVCRKCWVTNNITIRKITELGHDVPEMYYDNDGFRKRGYEKEEK